jgi:MFS family permease
MSIGYENIFRFPPYTNNWRAMTGDWPDAPWIDRRKVRTPWRGRFGSRAGYWIVALALLMTMATSAVPTPLYVVYQRRDHFSSLVVSIIYAVYAVGVIASLFLVGHVSDWLGRRRVLVIGLLMNVASALVFMVAPSLSGLIVARVISGLSIGLITATATAYLAELHRRAHPNADQRRAQIMAIAVNLGGIGFGPLVAGVLAQFAPAPLVLPYFVVGLALAVLAVLVVAAPETIEPALVRTRWHVQHIVVPLDARRQFFAACLAGLSAFAVYGVFSSLVPRFLAETMGITSHAIAGLVAFTVFASGALAQIALRSLKPNTLLRTGSPTLLVGLALLVTGIWSDALAIFVIATVVTGIGTGLIFRGAMAHVSESAPVGSHAETLAGFFLSAYVGLSIPVVAVGLASDYMSTRVLMLIFAVVVGLATSASVRLVVRGSTTATTSQHLAPDYLTTVPTATASGSFEGDEREGRVLQVVAATSLPKAHHAVHESRRSHRSSRVRTSESTRNQSPKCTKEIHGD